MLTETMSVGRNTALPPKFQSIVNRLQVLLLFIDRCFRPPTEVEKPDWMNCTDRVWRRHSAFLMSLHVHRGGDLK